MDNEEALALGQSLMQKSQDETKLIFSEDLRSQPIFIEDDLDWIEHLGIYSNEYEILEKIVTGEDLEIRQKELKSAEVMYEEIFGQDSQTFGYDDEKVKAAVKNAYNRGSIGSSGFSCPPVASGNTAFQAFSRNSKEIGGKILECDCPVCHKHVKATISSGKIHCPECGSSANYNC